MKDKQFDQHLRDVLDNLEPAYAPATWALLERRMDAAFAEEQPAPVDAVDKAVYHALERLETPYQAAHWDLLAQTLQRQAVQVRRLRVAKIAEAAILVLCLLNIDFFLNNATPSMPARPKPRPDVPVAQAGPGSSRKFSGRNAPDHPLAGAWAKALIQQALASPAAVSGLLSSDYLTAQHVPGILAELNALAEQSRNRVYAALPPADLLPNDALAGICTPVRSFTLPAVSVKKFKRPGSTYISAFASADQNWGQAGTASRSSAGYGAGMSIGYRPSEWGFETGISYAHKKQVPETGKVEIYGGNVVDGYWGTTMTDVSADLVSIPVKVTRQVARAGKARAHLVAGASACFAAQKSYDYGTVYYPSDFFPPNNQPDPAQKPKLREKGRGVLEQGGVRNNFYATLDAGIRIEHPIAKGRYTAFVEPAFRASVTGKGVGPKREPIHSVGIQAGIMAYL